MIFLELGASDISKLCLQTALNDTNQEPKNQTYFLALALRLKAAFALQNKKPDDALSILKPAFNLEKSFKNHLSKANIFIAKKDFLSVKKEFDLAKQARQNEQGQNHQNSLAQIIAFESFLTFNEGDLQKAKI